jgi:hypothetical protein
LIHWMLPHTIKRQCWWNSYWLKTRTEVYKQRGVKSHAEFESDVWSLVLVTQYVEVTKDTTQ